MKSLGSVVVVLSLWEAKLDAPGHTNPMTYLGPDGKQYVVIVSSGINAFTLE